MIQASQIDYWIMHWNVNNTTISEYFCCWPLWIHFSSRTQCNTRQLTFCSVLNVIYMIYFRNAFGEYCDIQIAIDYELKLKIYYISIFWLDFLVGYVSIIDLEMHTIKTDLWRSWLKRGGSGIESHFWPYFSFCNSRFLRVPYSSTQPVQMKSTVTNT